MKYVDVTNGNRPIQLAIPLLIAVTILLFYKGITVSFSSDDYRHLQNNIHFNTLKDACSVFFGMDGREYRPFVRLSLWLNHQMGDTAVPYHWTNVILHLSNILFVFFIFYYLVQSTLKAFVGSLIFALHPIHSTNVNFIMGRTDLVCAFFYLSSILLIMLYLHHGKQKIYYILSLLFFFFTLLSKEMAVSLPAVVFFIFLLSESKLVKKTIPGLIIHTLPFFIIDAIYLAVRIIGWHSTSDSVSVYTNFSVAHILKNLFMWAFALFYPFNLYQVRNFYESRPLNFLLIGLTVSIIIAGVIFFIVQRNKKNFIKDKFLLLSFIWFIVILLPITGGNAHRWYLYIPSISLSLFILAIWRSADKKKTFLILLLIYMGFCFSELYKQSTIWQEQSRVSQNFLSQVKENGLDKLDCYYMVNVPFGYKSAFLFTFKSLEQAILLNFDHKPDIKILSYINLSDKPFLKVVKEKKKLTCSLKQDAYDFFLFPPVIRRFNSNVSSIKIQDTDIKIKGLTPAKTVSDYEVPIHETNDIPLYYFDGKTIMRF